MIQRGDIIKIRWSKALLMLDLCELVTREAIVTEVVYKHDKIISGVKIIPQTGRLANKEVFIPAASIVCMEQIAKARTMGILKTTKL